MLIYNNTFGFKNVDKLPLTPKRIFVFREKNVWGEARVQNITVQLGPADKGKWFIRTRRSKGGYRWAIANKESLPRTMQAHALLQGIQIPN